MIKVAILLLFFFVFDETQIMLLVLKFGNFKFDATQLNKLNKQIFDIGCNHRNKHFFLIQRYHLLCFSRKSATPFLLF